MDSTFLAALQTQDLAALARVPKGDLHNHGTRGGSIADIAAWAGIPIAPLDHAFNDLTEMQAWYEAHVKCYCPGLAGYEVRIRSALRQARRDGVRKLVLTFGLDEAAPYGSPEAFGAAIRGFQAELAPEIDLAMEAAFLSTGDVAAALPHYEEAFASGVFQSLDTNGIEMTEPARYRPLYRLAKRYGLTLRAHVGEFGPAARVREAVETLELDEVQHGNAAVDDPATLRMLADNQIRLNVCPGSNLLLRRARDYKTHPIRRLFDAGVPVTINTDDFVIFNVSLLEMYLRFYQEGVFSPAELEQIRQWGLA
jgi:adenosine deaminase